MDRKDEGGGGSILNGEQDVRDNQLTNEKRDPSPWNDTADVPDNEPGAKDVDLEQLEEKQSEANEEKSSSPDPDVIKSCFASSSIDNDELKKDGDTSKAVTFAEDIEVYDLKAGTPITVSLDTPVHLVEPEENYAWSFGTTGLENNASPAKRSSENDDGFVATDLESPRAGHEKTEEKALEERSSALRPSILSLQTEAPGVVEHESSTVSYIGEKRNSADCGSPSGEPLGTVDDSADVDQKFVVSLVDESELTVDSGVVTVEENGHIPGLGVKVKELEEPDFNLKDTSSVERSTHSNDSMYHDTIGPLENLAFLKTLHYSASQHLDEEDQFGLHSNLDLASLAVGQNDPNLDGGWAWVVLTAAFFNLIILASTCLLSGVMMNSLVEVSGSAMTEASFIGSVFISIMCLTGPVVGTVTRKVGARVTVAVSGGVMFLGFIGSSFSYSVPHFILTHGFVAGIGAGFALNPTFVIVGQYFNRLRGLACGLIATGGGAGVLAGGALISQLLSSFGLHGTYLIWAAVCFHITPMGLLMRPSPEERLRMAEQELLIDDPARLNASSQQDLGSDRNSVTSGMNSMCSMTDQNSLHSGMTDKTSHSHSRRFFGLRRHPSKHSHGDVDAPLLKTILHREMSRSSHSMSLGHRPFQHHRSENQIASTSMQKFHSPFGSNNLVPSSSPVSSPTTTVNPLMAHLSNQTSRTLLTTHNVTSTNSLANSSHILSTSTLAPPNSASLVPPASPTSTRGPTRSSFNRPRLLSSVSQPTSHYTSLSHISQRLSFKGSYRGDLDNESMTSTLVSNLKPSDALAPRYTLSVMSISALMGSMASFPTSLAIINDDLSRVDGILHDATDKKTVKDYVIDVLDALRVIFKNKSFVVFLSTCFLWALGEAPIMMYLPSYAISLGTDPMQASTLYTAMGIGSIAGRFLTGLIATDKSIGPMLLHIGCLGLAGILVTLSPLITKTVVEQMAFSALLGVYTGALVPLLSLTTIELLGISELSIGFGFISMAQGFGYFIGPPLSGVLVSMIGFRYSFVFAGLTLLCGSLVGLLVPLFIEPADDDNNSLNDLEKMLQKIADSETGSDVDEGQGDVECAKEDDLKSHVETVPLMTLSGVDNHQSLKDESYFSISRNLEETEDKLETIKEIV